MKLSLECWEKWGGFCGRWCSGASQGPVAELEAGCRARGCQSPAWCPVSLCHGSRREGRSLGLSSPRREQGETELLYLHPHPRWLPRSFHAWATAVHWEPSSLCSWGLCPGLAAPSLHSPAFPASDVRLGSASYTLARVWWEACWWELCTDSASLMAGVLSFGSIENPAPKLDHYLLIFELQWMSYLKQTEPGFAASFCTDVMSRKEEFGSPRLLEAPCLGQGAPTQQTRLLPRPFSRLSF